MVTEEFQWEAIFLKIDCIYKVERKIVNIFMANTSIPRCVWAMNGNKKVNFILYFLKRSKQICCGKKERYQSQSQEVDKIINQEYKRKWPILANSENLVSSTIKFETKEAKTSDFISYWRKFSSSWIIQPNGAWWESRHYLCWNLTGGILGEYHHGLKVECDLD